MSRRFRLNEFRILQHLAVAALVWVRHVIADEYPGVPVDGSVFVGTFTCSSGASAWNTRVTFTTWPTKAYFEYYPTTSSSQPCSGSYEVELQGSEGWLPVNGKNTSSCTNQWPVGFFANLDATNQTFSGTMTTSSACSPASSTLEMTRQLGWETRFTTAGKQDKVGYTRLMTCLGSSGLYQYSRVVFAPAACACELGKPGCIAQYIEAGKLEPPAGGTEIILPGNSEVWAFTVPTGTSNFSVNLKGDTGSQIPLGLQLVIPGTGGNASAKKTMWFSLAGEQVDYAAGDVLMSTQMLTSRTLYIGQVSLTCETYASNSNLIGGECTILPTIVPEDVIFNVVVNYGNHQSDTLAKVSYSYYMLENCSDSLSYQGNCWTAVATGSCPAAPNSLVACSMSQPVGTTCKSNGATLPDGQSGDVNNCGGSYDVYTKTCQPVSTTSTAACAYGCCPKDKALSKNAVQIWSRAQRLSGIDNATKLVQPYGLDTSGNPMAWNLTAAGIPFYRWETAWNKSLGTNTDWAPYWALAFDYLDTNQDGYITTAEYQVGYNLEVGSCPTGYIQTSPIILSCNAISGQVSFSLKDLPSNNTVLIPAGVTNLSIKLSSSSTIDLRILDVATSSYVVYEAGPATVTASQRNGSWGGVDILYTTSASGGVTAYTVQFTGTLMKPVQVLAQYVITTGTGYYDYSTAGTHVCTWQAVAAADCSTTVAACTGFVTNGSLCKATSYFLPDGTNLPAVANCGSDHIFKKICQANCSSTIYENSCSAYDSAEANLAVQAWSSKLNALYGSGGRRLQASAASSNAWASTQSYRLLSFGNRLNLIPWGMFKQYWYSVFSTGGSEGAFRASAMQAFRFADSNNDGYVSESEFGTIYSSVLSCATQAGAVVYQSTLFLMSCTSKSSQTTVTVEPDASISLVAVPVGMTGLKLKASSTVHMFFSSTDTLANPNPSTATTRSPTGTSITVSMNGSYNVIVTTTDDGTNKVASATFQGATAGADTTTWYITNNDTSAGSITLEYSFTNVSCGQTFGCEAYNASLANTQGLNWSSRVSSQYNNPLLGWQGYSPQATMMGGIPFWSFPGVWCTPAQLAAGCPNWQLGFASFDANNDMLISESEFVAAFNLFQDAQLSSSALTDGCQITTRYNISEFPIPQMANIESCHCSTKLNEGWDSGTRVCMKRKFTTCDQCTHQKKCAKISTIVGSGLQEFLGDCPIGAPLSQCAVARQVSLAYPIVLDVDEYDNIYVADHGNNRIRMVSAENGWVRTIAGNGEVGFSGDGGLGYNARLRHPEGIAVNSLQAPAFQGASTCSTQERIVYFSDFHNQRVRKLTKTSNGWIITTVLGNGVRGDNPACNVSCPASQAILNNPRALALTRYGELYIVDSGNRKIRKLAKDGTFSTFLGSGSAYNNINIVAMRWQSGKLLSGTWEEDNLHVLLNSAYTIRIDKEDNLWVIDGQNNRLLRAPLATKTVEHTRGFIGRYATYFQLHYGQLLHENAMVDNMAKWLTYEFVDGNALFDPPSAAAGPVKIHRGQRVAGKTTWMYGSPEPGHWCEPTTRPDRCEPTQAQYTRFSRLLGLCFDVGNEIYVADQHASQVMKIMAEPMIYAPMTNEAKLHSTTISNCPCLQYWTDWRALGYDPSIQGALYDYAKEKDVQLAEMCTANPLYATYQIPDFMKVACVTIRYCNTGVASPICKINTTNMPHTDTCSPKSAPQKPDWGYCVQEALPRVSFEQIDAAGILGHEIRMNARCIAKKARILGTGTGMTPLKELMISWGERQVSQAFMCDEQVFVYPYTMLLGFVEPQVVMQTQPYGWSAPIRNSTCTSVCCGLMNATDSTGPYCAITNETDYQIFIDNYVIPLQDVPPDVTNLKNGDDSAQKANLVAKDWYGINLVWSALKTASKYEDQCYKACVLDSNCKAYVVRPDHLEPDPKNPTGDQKTYGCATFSETWPYNIFLYNKTVSPAWNVIPDQAYSRLFNFESATSGNDPANINHAYVNRFTDAQPMGYLSGPHSEDALDFVKCKKRCEDTPNDSCTSIAFPGCYLFNHTNDFWNSIKISSTASTKTLRIMAKSYISENVLGITGSPSVRAFSDDHHTDSLAVPALVNRPSSCAFDSAGHVVLADTWNHRIRRITQLHVECQYNMDLFTKDEVSEYRDRVNNMDQKCFTNSDAPFLSQRQSMQYGIMSSFQKSDVDLLCNVPSSTPTAVTTLTNSLQVMCNVCPETNRPTACPSIALCQCRQSIVNVLASKVYLNCPAQSAYYEKWHKFVSAYTACWMLKDDQHTKYMMPGTSRNSLLSALQR